MPFVRNPVRRASAKIVRHDRRSERGGIAYRPVFRFADARGVFIEVRDNIYTPFPTPVIGEMIEIIYPEGYPGKARIPDPVFRALLYGILGGGFLLIGLEITGLG